MYVVYVAFRSVSIVGLAVVLLTGAVSAQPRDTTAGAERRAKSAAQSWLSLIDDDAFGESWDEAASLLQERIEREEWIQEAERLRDSVETLSSRSLTQTQYRDSLRQPPVDGPFVLFKYRSTLETGRVEELLLTVRQDTIWKVAGYQVTPLRASSP